MIRLIRDIVLQPVIFLASLFVAAYYSTLGKNHVVKKYWYYSEKFKVSFYIIITDKIHDDLRSGYCLLRLIVIEKPNTVLINGQMYDLTTNQIANLTDEEIEHETYHYPQEVFLSVLFLVLYPYSHLIGSIYKINYRDRWFEK